MGGEESCIGFDASVLFKLLPPHDCSSEPSEQSFERSQTQPLEMHCSPLWHKNSLFGQKVLFSKIVYLKERNEINSFVRCANKRLIQKQYGEVLDENKSHSQTPFDSFHEQVHKMTYGNGWHPRPTRHYNLSPDRTAIVWVCIVRCCIGTGLAYMYSLQEQNGKLETIRS